MVRHSGNVWSSILLSIDPVPDVFCILFFVYYTKTASRRTFPPLSTSLDAIDGYQILSIGTWLANPIQVFFNT